MKLALLQMRTIRWLYPQVKENCEMFVKCLWNFNTCNSLWREFFIDYSLPLSCLFARHKSTVKAESHCSNNENDNGNAKRTHSIGWIASSRTCPRSFNQSRACIVYIPVFRSRYWGLCDRALSHNDFTQTDSSYYQKPIGVALSPPDETN